VIMDEIGRGTSTYDGLSIAWAVAEYLHDLGEKGVKTLFATHYHELTDLSNIKPRVQNFNIAVKEWNDEIIFLRKLVEGSTNRSYGIQVARLAGIPETIIRQAKKVLTKIENDDHNLSGPKKTVKKNAEQQKGQVQLSLFQQPDEIIIQNLQKLNISTMTPIDAINYLCKLKEKADSIIT
jgi:DNA mismatch repair protein MutS